MRCKSLQICACAKRINSHESLQVTERQCFNMSKCVAIVLAAGSGRRMCSDVPKQYMLLAGKPLLYYSLKTIEDSCIDEIILVTAGKDIDYCQNEIVNKYGLKKVTAVVAGGAERYHSVWNGICQIDQCDYLFIHDGARPFLTGDMIDRISKCVIEYDACVAAMPVKDTIKQVNEEMEVIATPRRDRLYQIQTPQAFRYEIIRQAYQKLIDNEEEIKAKGIIITDDSMVVETILSHKVRIVEGSYDNIKITTPEDILTAESLIKNFL